MIYPPPPSSHTRLLHALGACVPAAALADAWPAHLLNGHAAEKSLAVSFVEALRGRSSRTLQLLSIATVTIIVDTVYKSYHSEPSNCFFRTTATRSLELVCC